MSDNVQVITQRTSSRLRAKVAATAMNDSGQDSTEASGPANAPGASKRKRKAKTEPDDQETTVKGKAAASASKKVDATTEAPVKRRRGNRGLLEQVLEMPFDLLLEIFGKVEPPDLLNLARTSKALRQLIMSKSSAAIWRESLASDSTLPSRPDDLNEPIWVDLLYGRNCMVCNRIFAPHACYVIWEARFRACNKCLLDRLELKKYDPPKFGIPATVYKVLPRHTLNQGPQWKRERIYGPMWAEWKEEYVKITNPEQKERWANAKIEEFTARKAHAQECSDWKQDQADTRAEDTRAERESFMWSKLVELGFQEELDYWGEKGCMRQIPFFSLLVKRNITSKKVWEKLEAEFVSVSQVLRERRVKEIHAYRHRTISEFHKGVASEYTHIKPLIPAADLFVTKEVQSLLDRIPLSETLTIEHLEPIKPSISSISERWTAEVKERLLEMATEQIMGVLDVPKAKMDDIGLAFVVFRCKCSQCIHRPMLDWETALNHPSMATRDYFGGPKIPDAQLRAFAESTGECPWGVSMTLDTDRSKTLVELVKLLKYDLNTTTRSSLQDADDILECRACYKDPSRFLMDWRSAVDHKCTTDQLVKVDAKTTWFAQKLMPKTQLWPRTIYLKMDVTSSSVGKNESEEAP